MKWLAKYRISNALDKGWASDTGVPANQLDSEVREFYQTVTALDAALKKQVPGTVVVPEGLHESIMREVRRNGRKPRLRSLADAARVLWPRWVPVCVAGLLVLVLGWFLVWDAKPVQPTNESIASAAAPLLGLEDLAATAPSALTGPLATELERVRADLNATASFVLASVP